MAEAVYILCALTSVACTVMLFKGSLGRTRLLFWSSLCFAGLAVNNILLFVDLVLIDSIDLGTARNISGLIGMMLLLYGLIWESE